MLKKYRNTEEEKQLLDKLHQYACTEFDNFITQPVYLRNFINPCWSDWHCLLLKPCNFDCEQNLIEFAWERATLYLLCKIKVNISHGNLESMPYISAYKTNTKHDKVFSPIKYFWFANQARIYGYQIGIDSCSINTRNYCDCVHFITVDRKIV